jgi:hypothetical protein
LHWFVPFRLKTGVCTPLLTDACLDLLRTTFHLAGRFDRARWKSQFFHQAWKWLTFPLVLPYLLFLECKVPPNAPAARRRQSQLDIDTTHPFIRYYRHT